MMRSSVFALFACVLLAACGGDAPTDHETNEYYADYKQMYDDYNNKAVPVSKTVNALEKYLEKFPESSDAWQFYGSVLYYDMKDFAKAEESFQRAIELDPNSVLALASIGSIHRRDKDYNSALEYYNKAIAVDSAYAYGYNSLGVVYLSQGQYEDARLALDKAYSLDSTDIKTLRNRAIAYHAVDSTEVSSAMYKQAIAKGFTDTTILKKVLKDEIGVQEFFAGND